MLPERMLPLPAPALSPGQPLCVNEGTMELLNHPSVSWAAGTVLTISQPADPLG
jgi:hypothetical protein